MTSWKTTIFGLIGAIGAYCVTVPDPSWLSYVGKFLVVLSPAAMGYFARDKDVSSEQQGIK
jgi:hypothetical protein